MWSSSLGNVGKISARAWVKGGEWRSRSPSAEQTGRGALVGRLRLPAAAAAAADSSGWTGADGRRDARFDRSSSLLLCVTDLRGAPAHGGTRFCGGYRLPQKCPKLSKIRTFYVVVVVVLRGLLLFCFCTSPAGSILSTIGAHGASFHGFPSSGCTLGVKLSPFQLVLVSHALENDDLRSIVCSASFGWV